MNVKKQKSYVVKYKYDIPPDSAAAIHRDYQVIFMARRVAAFSYRVDP